MVTEAHLGRRAGSIAKIRKLVLACREGFCCWEMDTEPGTSEHANWSAQCSWGIRRAWKKAAWTGGLQRLQFCALSIFAGWSWPLSSEEWARVAWQWIWVSKRALLSVGGESSELWINVSFVTRKKINTARACKEKSIVDAMKRSCLQWMMIFLPKLLLKYKYCVTLLINGA